MEIHEKQSRCIEQELIAVASSKVSLHTKKT